MQTQPNVSTPLPAKPVEEKPYLRKFQKLETVEDEQAKQTEIKPEISEKQMEDVEPARGFKQKADSVSPIKTQNNLLDAIKLEKKLKTEDYSTSGHVLKKTKAEPMEIDSVNNIITNATVSSSHDRADSENFEEQFVFVSAQISSFLFRGVGFFV